MFTRNSIVLSNNIKTPLTAISRAIGNILQLTYGQLVKQLFSNQEQGFAYDPNDLTTLYQDAAGTTPVTAAGQPVGLMLDKSKGLSLSAELFTAALDFNNWSRTVAVTSVTANSFTTNGSGGCIKNPITTGMSLTKAYQVRIFGTCNVAHKIRSSSTYVGEVSVPAGAFDVTIKSPITFADSSMYFQLQAAGTITVNSISIKELAGNHAYQTVSASRPILQQTPILGSELVVNGDFTDTTKFTKEPGWTVSGGNGVASGVVGNISQSVQSTIGKTYLISGEVLSRTVGSVRLLADGTNVPIVTTTTPKVFSYIVTASLATIGIGFRSIDGFTGTVDNLSVKEVTGYRTDQNYLSFDGVDDFLQTNSIDFTATDKVSLFAGVRKLSDAALGMVCELSVSANSNAGSFYVLTPSSTTSPNYSFASSAGIIRGVSQGGYAAPHSAVLTCIGNISSPLISISVNNSIATTVDASQGTGNYGNYPLYIGRRAGTSLPFNGHIYSLIGIGRLTTDSETAALEKAIAKNTGVTLSV